MKPELQALLDSLESQRAHVLGIVEGLTDDELGRPVLPSGWSILGLIHHLAVDVERFWFREVVAGDHSLTPVRAVTSAWDISPSTRSESILETYRREIELANAVVVSTPLEAEPKVWPDFFGEWKLPDLRAVLLHVITETACHADTSTPPANSSTGVCGSNSRKRAREGVDHLLDGCTTGAVATRERKSIPIDFGFPWRCSWRQPVLFSVA